jgi:hypothetical protein
LTTDELLERLSVFDASGGVHLRVVRRPASRHLLAEVEADLEDGTCFYGLADFWLAALWRFLEDSHQNQLAFEGLAFQALAEALSPSHFEQLYGDIQAHLILPPPQRIELGQAYRLLQGRLTSFAGTTRHGTLWAAFFQANDYSHE